MVQFVMLYVRFLIRSGPKAATRKACLILHLNSTKCKGVLLENGNKTAMDTVALLAHLWAAHMNAVLRANLNLPKDSMRFIHLEDLILKPRKTAESVFRCLGVPLSPASEHRILTVVRTEEFSLGASREVVGAKTVEAWEQELKREDAERIKDICDPVMTKLRYDVDELDI